MKSTRDSAHLSLASNWIGLFPALMIIVVAVALGGCAVGPDYVRPDATTIPASY